jgi:hypothetical protein
LVGQLRRALSLLSFSAPSPAARSELGAIADEVLAIGADLKSMLEPDRSSSKRLRAPVKVPTEEHEAAQAG